MTKNETQKRTQKANHLNVFTTDINNYYVESAEGKICYKVFINDEETTCSCGDFARHIKGDPSFRCKHIIAVFSTVNDGGAQKVDFLEKRKPKLDERFVVNIEGNDFVKYAGLLDLGHQKGIHKIEVELLQIPSKDNSNTAICRAVTESKTGETFIDVGDANPGNCNAKVSKHLIRLASTRAIARSLRTFTNIGMTALEELGDYNDIIKEEPQKPKKRSPLKKVSTSKSKSADDQTPEKTETPPEKSKSTEKSDDSVQPEPKMSEAQTRAIHNLARRRGITVQELENMVHVSYEDTLENLSAKSASEFIRTLQQAS